MPLADVARILANEDPGARAELVAGHLQRLEAELDRTRAAVASLRQLLRPDVAELAVRLRSVPARTVAAISGTVDHDDVLAWYAEAMTELDAALAGRERLGPPGGCFDNELFTAGRGTVLVYRPSADPPARGRVTPRTLPAVELATAVHHGAHDGMSARGPGRSDPGLLRPRRRRSGPLPTRPPGQRSATSRGCTAGRHGVRARHGG